MKHREWYKLRCVECSKSLLVPEHVARRIADGVGFVMCHPCGDRYEALSGHEASKRFDPPKELAG